VGVLGFLARVSDIRRFDPITRTAARNHSRSRREFGCFLGRCLTQGLARICACLEAFVRFVEDLSGVCCIEFVFRGGPCLGAGGIS
jgi:hypothetical protein